MNQPAVAFKDGLPLLLVHLQPTGTNYGVFYLSQYMSWLVKKLLDGSAWFLTVLRAIHCTSLCQVSYFTLELSYG